MNKFILERFIGKSVKIAVKARHTLTENKVHVLTLKGILSWNDPVKDLDSVCIDNGEQAMRVENVDVLSIEPLIPVEVKK